ncbi:hypothetical protein N431DRAFT_550683, partial [Stipitochalara longipes BDJ]
MATRVFHGPHACEMCRKRKRKCDRRLPRCSLCFQVNQFPAVFFLDQDVFQQGMMTIPNPATQIPINISRIIGNDVEIRAVALRFFETVHSYMPIISRKHFFDQLLNPLCVPRADVALLCLCIKLMTGLPSPSAAQPQTDIYLCAKQYFVELEVAGIFSLQVLQSGLLIALYELGHGIYPSAYLSISTCVAYAFAMDLHSGATSKMTSKLNWVEREERSRVWWAIIILERIGNLGWPGRPLATPDPTGYDLLPSDDEAWDAGLAVKSHPINLSTASDTNMGRFARLALSTHLLSLVFRHISEPFHVYPEQEGEVRQLVRTINALIVLCELEGKRRSLRYCCPVDVCNSALLMLHTKFLVCEPTVSDSEEQSYHWTMAKEVMERTVMNSKGFVTTGMIALEETSPMVLYSTYKAASLYIWIN